MTSLQNYLQHIADTYNYIFGHDDKLINQWFVKDPNEGNIITLTQDNALPNHWEMKLYKSAITGPEIIIKEEFAVMEAILNSLYEIGFFEKD